MNKSQNDAIILAQKIKDATAVAKRANAQNYNWLPLVDFLTSHESPAETARELRTIYYDFVNYVLDGPDCGGSYVANLLYSFRSIIEAISDMQSETDKGLLAFAAPCATSHY